MSKIAISTHNLAQNNIFAQSLQKLLCWKLYEDDHAHSVKLCVNGISEVARNHL
jgi:hypothetical protein